MVAVAVMEAVFDDDGVESGVPLTLDVVVGVLVCELVEVLLAVMEAVGDEDQEGDGLGPVPDPTRSKHEPPSARYRVTPM